MEQSKSKQPDWALVGSKVTAVVPVVIHAADDSPSVETERTDTLVRPGILAPTSTEVSRSTSTPEPAALVMAKILVVWLQMPREGGTRVVHLL